jgi:hypothetical protein
LIFVAHPPGGFGGGGGFSPSVLAAPFLGFLAFFFSVFFAIFSMFEVHHFSPGLFKYIIPKPANSLKESENNQKTNYPR